MPGHAAANQAPRVKRAPTPRRIDRNYLMTKKREMDSKVQSFNYQVKQYQHQFGKLKNLSIDEWCELVADEERFSALQKALANDSRQLGELALGLERALNRRFRTPLALPRLR